MDGISLLLRETPRVNKDTNLGERESVRETFTETLRDSQKETIRDRVRELRAEEQNLYKQEQIDIQKGPF